MWLWASLLTLALISKVFSNYSLRLWKPRKKTQCLRIHLFVFGVPVSFVFFFLLSLDWEHCFQVCLAVCRRVCVFLYDVSLKLSTVHTCCLTNLCLFYSSVSNHSLYLFPTPFLIFPCSFLEQPVDHSLPIAELVLDQQLCVQLPAPMAPQSNNQPRKRRLPPMVRCVQTYICLKNKTNINKNKINIPVNKNCLNEESHNRK